MVESRLLKKDLFGEIRVVTSGDDVRLIRDASVARPGLRWLARRLLQREARALAALDGLDGFPALLVVNGDRLERRFIAGMPMQRARPRDPRYFKAAAALLRRLHRACIVHNDLAKEPNLLVTSDGQPAFVDFQLAWHTQDRGRLFRLLAHEDLRHLLKHKRSYCPELLTRRELAILANPSWPSRIWMRTIKPLYLLVTRRLLGWADREGAGDRGEPR